MRARRSVIVALVTCILVSLLTVCYVSNYQVDHRSMSSLFDKADLKFSQRPAVSRTSHRETKKAQRYYHSVDEKYSEKGQFGTRGPADSAWEQEQNSQKGKPDQKTGTNFTTEVKIWLFANSGNREEAVENATGFEWVKNLAGSKMTVVTESLAKAKGLDVSCYPRLFREVSSSGSTRSDCDCDCADCGIKSPRTKPVEHVFFLKTHKTGSQTLTGIFNRYALTHDLTVAVRKQLYHHAAAGMTRWISAIRPLPATLSHYDMLTDHVRFDEGSVRHFLPGDALFVTVVREPLDRFVSAFYYYRDVWRDLSLVKIPGPDPLLTYLSDMDKWDPPYGYNTNSRTAYDLGLQSRSQWDDNYTQASLKYLSQVFHLVLITEAFDESVILLKRTLSWNLKDVLYVKFNVGKTRRFYNFTRKQRDDFEKSRKGEYAIYRHFRSIFYKKLAAEGETFAEEVKVFKTIRSNVESFCNEVTNSSRVELRVEASKFSERFRVSVDDCDLLKRESSSVKDNWFEHLMIKRVKQKS